MQEVQEEPQSSESDDEFCIYAMNSHQNNNDADEWISPLVVNGSLVPFKVDTGAQVYLREYLRDASAELRMGATSQVN